MFTANFQEVIFHREGLIFPSNQKVFRLRYLQITPLGTDTEDSSKMYAIVQSRSNEVICHLKVYPDDENDFKSLLNMLVSSKLGL